MPYISLPPPPSSTLIFPLVEREDAALAYGHAGEKVRHRLTVACEHLQSPMSTSHIISSINDIISSNDEVPDYSPIPPRDVFTIHVKCEFIGPGKSLPYPLEDEDE